MKQFTFFTFFLSLLFCSVLRAQPSSVEWDLLSGEEIPANKYRWFKKHHNGAVYRYKKSKNQVTIKKYSISPFKKLYELELERKEEGDKNYSQFIVMDNAVHVFYWQFDKKRKVLSRYVRKVNASGSIGPFKLIAEIPSSKSYKAVIGQRFSRDGKTLMLLKQFEVKKGENAKYGLEVYDEDYNKMWEDEITFPYTAKEFTIKKWSVTNDRAVVALMRSRDDQNKLSVNLVKFMGDSYEKLPVNFEEPVYSDDVMSVDLIPGKIVLHAWTHPKKSHKLKGLMVYTFDYKTWKETNRDVQKFSEKMNSRILNHSGHGWADGSLSSMEMRRAIPKKGGGFYILAEKQMTQKVEIDEKVTYLYYDIDIFVCSVDGHGNIDFMDVIPKFQEVKSERHFVNMSSFGYYADSQDNLHIFYTDHVENKNNMAGSGVELKAMKNPVKGAIMHVEVNENGIGKKNQVKLNSKVFTPKFRSGFPTEFGICLPVKVSNKVIKLGTLSVP